jgi:hypothetical protein
MVPAQLKGNQAMRRAQTIAAMLALSFGVGGTAFADDDDITGPDVPRDQWRPITEIVEQFTAMGYQVRGIEGDDNLYEVEAIDSNGLWVKAYVHPVSGEILRERSDDD